MSGSDERVEKCQWAPKLIHPQGGQCDPPAAAARAHAPCHRTIHARGCAEGRAGENDALLVTPVRRPPHPRPEPCPPTPTCAPQSESSAAMRAARACTRP
jgi:hypothetical protein